MMEREKLEELIEKNVSREEAKKLLKNERLLKEFDQIMEMKEVLSDMHISQPRGLMETVLSRGKKLARAKRRNFAFVLASLLAVVFVSLFFIRGVLPLNISSPARPFSDSVRAPAQKSVPSGEFNLTKSILPEIKLKLSENASEAEAKRAIDKYCKWESKDVCIIKEEKISTLVNELKKFGEVQVIGVKEINIRTPEESNLEREVKIKIEVIKK